MATDVLARSPLPPARLDEARRLVDAGTLPSTALLAAGAPPDVVLHALAGVAGVPEAPPRPSWRPEDRGALGQDERIWEQLLAVPIGTVGERPRIAFADLGRMGSSLVKVLPEHLPCVALEADVREALSVGLSPGVRAAVSLLAPPTVVQAALEVGPAVFTGAPQAPAPEPAREWVDATDVMRGDGAGMSHEGGPSVAPGRRFGRFVLQRAVGSGGMATVFLGIADDGQEPSRAAVKVLHDHLLRGPDGEGLRRRFRREVATMRQQDHPNIIACLEAGSVGTTEYFAAEFVPGGSLRSRLARTGRLPPSMVLSFFGELLDGLAHAHGHGVIHRDLKPDNLLMADAGLVKIADFGIARISEGTTLTNVGGAVGTPAYMSPEQVLAQPLDMRSDLYSLAVICYEAIAGMNPFHGDTVGAVLANVVLGRAAPLADVEPAVPLVLEAVVNRSLALRPDDRFPTALAVRRALRPALRRAAEFRPYWARLVDGDEDALGEAISREADLLLEDAYAVGGDGLHPVVAALRVASFHPRHPGAREELRHAASRGLHFARSTDQSVVERENKLADVPEPDRLDAWRRLGRDYLAEQNPLLAARYLRRAAASRDATAEDLDILLHLLSPAEVDALRTVPARLAEAV